MIHQLTAPFQQCVQPSVAITRLLWHDTAVTEPLDHAVARRSMTSRYSPNTIPKTVIEITKG